MTITVAQRSEPQIDQVAAVLNLFEGDVNAAIGALLAQLPFIRGQLALCETRNERRLHPWLGSDL